MQGNILSGVKRNIILNGKTYIPTTDKKGQVKVSSNALAPTITYKGSAYYNKETKKVNIKCK